MAWIRHDRCPPRRSPDPWGPPSALRSVHLGAGRSPADAGRTRRTFFGPILPILSMGMSPDIRRRRSPPPAPRRWEIRAYRTATSSESPGTVHWDCSLGLFILGAAGLTGFHAGRQRLRHQSPRSPALLACPASPGDAGSLMAEARCAASPADHLDQEPPGFDAVHHGVAHGSCLFGWLGQHAAHQLRRLR
jgi:hypothetical protein